MTSSPQGFKVALLVSDDQVRDAASSVLTTCSYKVTPAASVDDCLFQCTIQRIDIVLAESSDLTADKEKTVQLMGSLKSIPLIVMSDSDTPSTVFHGLKIGAVDFLKRPLDESKVRSMWQHTLQKRMTSMPVVGDDGGCDFPRRTLNSAPMEATTMLRKRTGLSLSEGSSNDQKAVVRSTLESTPAFDFDPHSAQNFTSENRSEEMASETMQAHETNRTDTAARKRVHRSSQTSQRRRIRSNLTTRDGPASTNPDGTAAETIMPPLLGIPPGCVPPIGSNGQAIGMPFLNQHPFVPTQPMRVDPVGCMPPFLFPQVDPDTMPGQSPILESHFSFPFGPLRPSTGFSIPLGAQSMPGTVPSQRSAHPMVIRTEDDFSTGVVSSQEEPVDVPRRPLQKSSSLVHF